jgi:hypothetical protein
LLLTALTVSLLAGTPEVAVLSTAPESEVTELRFQALGDSKLSPVAGQLVHLPRESALGAMIPGTRSVVVVAATAWQQDLSFASSLFVLEPGKAARVLADRVAISTRPLVTADGRVFVQRGRPGEGRIDSLTIDEIDVRTGRAREVLAFSGYTAFLAGSIGRELLVYRVGLRGADLIAVHADALGVRVLIPALPALARDFAETADGRALLFTQGEPNGTRWFVERLDLTTLALTRLGEGPTMALLPTPLPDGRVAFSPGEGLGLKDLEGATVVRANGKGFERVRFFTRKGIAVGLHETPGEFPAPLGGFAAPSSQRLDVAGVVE